MLDFIYLPMDFVNWWNLGYCFVNFRRTSDIARFVDEYEGAKQGHAQCTAHTVHLPPVHR